MNADVPTHLAAVLVAATRAWRPLPVQATELLHTDKRYDRLILEPPGNRPLAEDTDTGDLVLIPLGGWWEIAMVIGPDPCHDTHVKVAYVGHNQLVLTLAANGRFPPVPSQFFVQRNNCYRTHALEARTT